MEGIWVFRGKQRVGARFGLWRGVDSSDVVCLAKRDGKRGLKERIGMAGCL